MTAGAVSRVCDVTGMITTAMSLRHLSRLTDQNGIAERAKGATPQPEYGYSLIDQARLLVVALRHNFDVPCQSGLVRTAMQFIMEAQDPDGSFRTRRIPNQHWTVEPNAGEAWGAAMWACGVAAAQSRSPMLRREALAAYTHGLGQRSIQLRPMCLAALGAAEILSVDPTHDPSLDLLADAADLIWSSYSTPDWPWPETRLTQINAVIPEALILASGGLGRLRQRAEAIDLLRWLIGIESHGNRLSVTPTSGRTLGDPRPAFAQSPLEVASLAEACARAANYDDDPIWTQTILAAGAWFLGHNDRGEMMIAASTGGCFDGLHATGVDPNQGAAATLAMISTLQRALKVTALTRV
jgi:hypothetical protein